MCFVASDNLHVKTLVWNIRNCLGVLECVFIWPALNGEVWNIQAKPGRKMFFRNQYICALADQGVGRGVLDMRASPPLGPISVIFMQFLEKNLQNNIFSPPTVRLVPPPPPPSGKSWIGDLCGWVISKIHFPTIILTSLRTRTKTLQTIGINSAEQNPFNNNLPSLLLKQLRIQGAGGPPVDQIFWIFL